jgi:hypothetical protein
MMEFFKNLPEWAVEPLKASPTLLFSLLVMWLCGGYIARLHAEHIKSKDAEIKRLVEEKNALQKIVLRNRLSTEPKDAKSGKGGMA